MTAEDFTGLPLLEDDLAEPSVITAAQAVRPGPEPLPPVAVMCWFRDVVAALHDATDARRWGELESEAGINPVFGVRRGGCEVAVVQPGVGAPMAAMVLEELVALGVRTVVGCGGAGALLPELVLGHAIVVESAVRDEGTSFHYLPATRGVDVDPAVVRSLVGTAERAGVTHVVGRTWTTDAPFRETRTRVDRRVAEGCVAVEMEAAAMIAAARVLGVPYGQYLMAGDSLAGETWDSRGWTTAAAARQALFDLAVDAAVDLVAGPGADPLSGRDGGGAPPH